MMTNELQERYNALALRCNELSSGNSTVSVTLEYSWNWDQGVTGRWNLWLNADRRCANSKLNELEVSLHKDYSKRISDFIEDVDKFVADGGEWDYW